MHHRGEPSQIDEVPICELPPQVMGYIYPSRYCQSDRLLTLATAEFGKLRRGYGRVQAIRDWVHGHVTFKSNSSNSSTSAIDTLIERVGVCRDFAHLMIALCRAVNIPARFATGTDYGADPALGPPDFQAYVEVFLGGRWYIFDPSGTAIPMGFVRFGTGRDAADVAFATIFGGVKSQAPVVRALGHRGCIARHRPAPSVPGRAFDGRRHGDHIGRLNGTRPEAIAGPASRLLARCSAASWLQWLQSALYGVP